MLTSRFVVTLLVIALIGPSTVFAFSMEFEHNAQIEIMTNAKIKLSEAVSGAEAQLMGRALEAALMDNVDGAFLYRIDILKGGKLTEVRYQLDSGEILAGKAGILKSEAGAMASRLVVPEETEITLTQAIIMAETHGNGIARCASLITEQDKVFYAIEVLRDGRLYQMNVDVSSGRLLSSQVDRDI